MPHCILIRWSPIVALSFASSSATAAPNSRRCCRCSRPCCRPYGEPSSAFKRASLVALTTATRLLLPCRAPAAVVPTAAAVSDVKVLPPPEAACGKEEWGSSYLTASCACDSWAKGPSMGRPASPLPLGALSRLSCCLCRFTSLDCGLLIMLLDRAAQSLAQGPAPVLPASYSCC